MSAALIIGSTGLVGKSILSFLDSSTNFNKIVNIGRREPATTSSKIVNLIDKDTEKWGELIETSTSSIADIDTAFSSFGTTRAAAGSADNFLKIDYGINYEFAKAAKKRGVDTFVLISSQGASAGSPFLYMKTKGKLEDDIIALKFPRTIIIRPGVLLGEREGSKGFGNDVAGTVGRWLYRSKFQLGLNPVKGEEVAKVAVNLAEQPYEKDSDKPQVKIVGATELLDLSASIN